MRLTDPVADMLTRVRNALQARHQKVDIPASKLKTEIARILKEEGYIANYKATEEDGHKVIRVYLKYGSNNEAAISNVARVSRPGCRVYVRRTEIPRVLGGLGINILAISTSEIKVSVLLPEEYTELAVRVLHTAFGLDSQEQAA